MDNPLPPVDPDHRSKSRSLLRIALLVSLAVNIAIVCAVAGFLLSGRTTGGPARGFDFGVGPIASAFDKQDRDDMRRALEARTDLRPLRRRDMVERLTTVAELLRQDPFDPDAVAQAFGDMRSRATALQTATQAIVIEKLADMSAQERAAFADKVVAAINQRRSSRPNR